MYSFARSLTNHILRGTSSIMLVKQGIEFKHRCLQSLTSYVLSDPRCCCRFKLGCRFRDSLLKIAASLESITMQLPLCRQEGTRPSGSFNFHIDNVLKEMNIKGRCWDNAHHVNAFVDSLPPFLEHLAVPNPGSVEVGMPLLSAGLPRLKRLKSLKFTLCPSVREK